MTGATEPDSRPEPPHPPVVRFTALTTLRFPAAAVVIAYHYHSIVHPAGLPPSFGLVAYGAVTFFFVLSGFILTHNYGSVGFSRPDARHAFYRARIARIGPLYLVSIGAALPFFAAHLAKLAPVPPLMAAAGLLTPLGLQAWLPGAACALNCPTWSVSADMTFYALFPLLLPPLLRQPGRSALVVLLAWCAAGAAASFAWDAWSAGASLLAPEPAGPGAARLAQFIKFNPLLRLPEFLLGILLYGVWRRWVVAPPVLLALAAGMALGLAAAAPSIPEPFLHNGLTALIAAPLILAAAAIRTGPLAWGPLVFLGNISFACYLLHVPAAAAIQALDRIAADGALRAHPWTVLVLACALTLAASVLLHLHLEEPARRLILRARRGLPSRPVESVPETMSVAAPLRTDPLPSLWMSLQYLRAVAALMVVTYHMHQPLQRLGYQGGWPDWTQRGVDVFFVISGVVMWLTTRGRTLSPLAFYRRRILRIVPLYYLLTTLIVLTLIALPAAVQSGRFDGFHVLGSFVFLPVQHPVLGTPVPVLVPGWTLNCEMVFYAVFGFTLSLREGLRIPATVTALALIVLAGTLAPADSAAAALYGSSIMLEFGLGLALGAVIGGGRSLPARYAWAVLGLGTLALAVVTLPDAPRCLTVGLPACAIVAGALSLEHRGHMPTLPPLLLLGDASYALYLSHGIVLSAWTQFALKAGLGSWVWSSLVFAVAGFCTVLVSAVALYRYVERPLLRRLATARASPSPVIPAPGH